MGNSESIKNYKDKSPANIPKKRKLLRKISRGNTVVRLRPLKEEKKTTLEILLDAFNDIVVICDGDMNKIIACNNKIQEKIGISNKDLIEKPLFSILNQSTLQRLRNGETVIKNQEMECASALHLPVDINVETLDWEGEEVNMLKIKDLQDDQEIKRVVAEVVHDLNNAFSVIFGNTSFLNESNNFQNNEDLEGILNATKRGISLVRQLQNLSTEQIYELQEVEITEMIHELTSSLSYWQSRYGVQIGIECHKKHICSVDVAKFTEAIFNLLKNAKDAIPHGGKITISIQDKPFHANKTQAEENFKKGLYLKIEDNGTGIPTDHINKIFNPTFSTKKIEKKGYGFGLSNVLKVVKAHKGSISVESRTGENSFTRFLIFIPE